MDEPDRNWQIRPRNLFVLHTVETEDSGVHGELLIQVTDAGTVEDSFRVALAGRRPVRCQFRGSAVSTAPELARFTFNWEVQPEDIDLRENLLASGWEDLLNMLENEVVSATDAEGQLDLSEEARKVLADLKEARADAGVALRWALRANTARVLRLQVLALLTGAKHIKKKPIFDSDMCPGILLKSEAVRIPMASGFLRGPRPTLFASDPKAAEANLHRDCSVAWPGRIVACHKLY